MIIVSHPFPIFVLLFGTRQMGLVWLQGILNSFHERNSLLAVYLVVFWTPYLWLSIRLVHSEKQENEII